MNLRQTILKTPKPVIGLTGGIACGKSYVSHILHDIGWTVIDGDVLARNILRPDSKELEGLLAKIGYEYMFINQFNEKCLNRSLLRNHVFANTQLRQALDTYMKPILLDEFSKALETYPAELGYILDSALWVEMGEHSSFDQLWVVSADTACQIRRLQARDMYTVAEAEDRIKAQLPLEEKVKVATVVINNSVDDLGYELVKTLQVLSDTALAKFITYRKLNVLGSGPYNDDCPVSKQV